MEHEMTGTRLILRGGESSRQLPPSDGTSCPNCGFAWNQHDKGSCPTPQQSAMVVAEEVMVRFFPPKDRMRLTLAMERCKRLIGIYQMNLRKGGVYAPGGGLK